MTHRSTPIDTVFHRLEDFLALPRLSRLAMTADGQRLVASVQRLDDAGTGYVSSLWEIDPLAEVPARMLVDQIRVDDRAQFTASGDLMFLDRRPAAHTPEAECPVSVWRLPAHGGEARCFARRSGTVGGVYTATGSDGVLITAKRMPSAVDDETDRTLRESRSKAKVSAILHATYPVRWWDHDLGPDRDRLFFISDPEGDATHHRGGDSSSDLLGLDTRPQHPTREILVDDTHSVVCLVVAPNGEFAIAECEVPEARAGIRSILVRLDLVSGERTTLADFGPGGSDVCDPVISPDGEWVAFSHSYRSTGVQSPRVTLWVMRSDGTQAHEVMGDWDRWPKPVGWTADGSAVVVLADDAGHTPVFVIPIDPDADVTDIARLTGTGVYSSVCISPDGRWGYALRADRRHPAEVVRFDLTAETRDARDVPDSIEVLRGPSERPVLPGRAESVETHYIDAEGQPVTVKGWLAIPQDASPNNPAPLLLWIHGGPLTSWSGWSWRWNPWLMVARGYAVLMPDPALSTGYGQNFIQRGWGTWGDAPYIDLMKMTDAIVTRLDIDEDRGAAMGASFGGFMANWIAGHTDRFRAIVTHAGLWALDQFGPTTDTAFYWRREMTPDMAFLNSPHRFVRRINTPMLVIHGDNDYRVPVGEGLRLWHDLLASSRLPSGEFGVSPHRFLYFPDEGHWVTKPQHTKLWYEVISAFLSWHVLGEAQDLPELLG